MALTLSSSVGELLDDPRVVEFFKENFEFLLNHPNLEMAKSMPFNMIVSMSQGKISNEDCDKIEAFLNTLE